MNIESIIPSKIYCENTIGARTGFSTTPLVFHCQYRFNYARYLIKYHLGDGKFAR